jgi:hypothetical protein
MSGSPESGGALQFLWGSPKSGGTLQFLGADGVKQVELNQSNLSFFQPGPPIALA